MRAGRPWNATRSLRHADPSMQARVVREELEQRLVGGADVRRIARERRPAERAASHAELRTDVRRHEAREVEGPLEARIERPLAHVVAVVEDLRARIEEGDHETHMFGHALHAERGVLLGIVLAQPIGVFSRQPIGVVACERIVRRSLIGEGLRHDAALLETPQQVDRVAEPADRDRLALRLRLEGAIDRGVEAVDLDIEVPVVDALREPLAAHLRHQADAFVHGDGQRLGTAHAAAARGHVERALERASEVLASALGEGLVGPLQDALRADVDPAARGHLSEHHEAARREIVEVLLRRPVRHEVRVGDHHARRVGVGADHPDRLARLDEQRLVGAEFAKALDDRIEGLPRACGLAAAAVDDEVLRPLRDLGVEVVHEHPHRGLGGPGAAGLLRSSGRSNDGARRLRWSWGEYRSGPRSSETTATSPARDRPPSTTRGS